jgi:hypothetical protein
MDTFTQLLKILVAIGLTALVISQIILQIHPIREQLTGVDRHEGLRLP